MMPYGFTDIFWGNGEGAKLLSLKSIESPFWTARNRGVNYAGMTLISQVLTCLLSFCPPYRMLIVMWWVFSQCIQTRNSNLNSAPLRMEFRDIYEMKKQDGWGIGKILEVRESGVIDRLNKHNRASRFFIRCMFRKWQHPHAQRAVWGPLTPKGYHQTSPAQAQVS